MIVAVPDIATPAAQAAMRRLRRGLVVLTPGRSTIPEIESVVNDLSQRQISILGAVFIDRHERSVRQKEAAEPKQPSESAKVKEEAPVESPIARLGHYPIPGERSAVVESNPMQELAEQVAIADGGAVNDEALGGELLSALDSASDKGAVEAVADYLVTRTEDMVQAGYGQGGFSEELINAVSTDGFLSLRPLADHSTVGQWLEDELKREMSQQTAQEVIDRLERILSKQAGKVITVDAWLSEQFFTRHLARTDGEPDIWHLTSTAGTVQVLLSARRLDHDRIEKLISDVGSRTIDELMRYRKAATTRGDLEQADVFEGRIHEVRQFSTALGQLIGIDERGNSDFVWTPDWSDGVRANLAPFQRVGVLPVRVLSDAEVSSALSVG